ncbi:hypothetical protein [Neoroseomonas soli]|uniref:Uncharacterized protein n=1 Tax=Neoroseomonas soli TaxID=1081025 RepID=A0A9X9WSJ9_9PROT|nr:hypothetical protein [Neoroseomonas soli]MBR0670128.1 hypothetical protein [Neoroseomonas soli]
MTIKTRSFELEVYLFAPTIYVRVGKLFEFYLSRQFQTFDWRPANAS